ncbi:MAG: hypothetical protein ACF8NJ_04470, partial [Phycisphaerales bacterium JB038]
FLMVAFLVPGALQRIGRNVDRRPMFYLGDQLVRGRAYFKAQRELQFLEMLGVPIAENVEGLPGLDRIDGPEHWIMLKQLAEDGGYVGSIEQGRQFFTGGADPSLTEAQRSQINLIFDRAARRSGFADEEAGRVASYYQGVRRMLSAYARAAKISPLRTVAFADKLEDRVVTDVLFIPPEEVLEGIIAPGEAELAELCYQHRDALPGTGEFGFGYRQPAQVKFEYLSIREEVVEQTAEIDRILARKHYLLNKAAYATRVAKTEEEVVYDDVREMVLNDLRAAQVDETTREIERFISEELARVRKGLVSEGRYFVLPEDWETRRADFETIAGKIAEQFGIDRPEVIRRAGEWIAIETLSGPEDSLERSFITVGKEQVFFDEILMRLREVEAFDEGSYQLGVGIGPLRDAFGNSYFARVLQARPARPAMPEMPEGEADPAAWKLAQWQGLEVGIQARVREDARRKGAYDALAAAQETWRQRVLEEGLEAVAEDSRGTLLRGERIARMGWDGEAPDISLLGRDEGFVSALHGVIAGLSPEASVAEARTLPERTVLQPIAAQQGLAIAQLTDREPLTDRGYRLQVLLGVQQVILASELEQVDSHLPFSIASLIERLDYRPARKPRQTDAETTEEGEQMEAGEEASEEESTA